MAFSISKHNWFIRYKLYHVPFWIVYNYIWWVVAVGYPDDAARAILFTPFAIKFFFYVIFQIIAVCFNLYYLIPKLMEKGRITAYIISLVLTILITAVCIVPGYYISAYFYHGTVESVYGVHKNRAFFELWKDNPIQSTLACITLSMSIKLTKNWIQTRRRQQELEKEKLETELKFLKYQFNPHFLFNSINSIFFLIHKNQDMASASLAKFSELLRHQLYECNDRLIPFSKEITYLQNFIELEKLRQSPDLGVTFDVSIADNTNSLGIAPFILMTFVENAFKHVSHDKDRQNRISIKLKTAQKTLIAEIVNTTSVDDGKQVVSYGGIGLKNVQRRLDLVYPDVYVLDIERQPEWFTVKLQLQLDTMELNEAAI